MEEVVDHGPRFISVGWLDSPRFEPKGRRNDWTNVEFLSWACDCGCYSIAIGERRGISM
jgi:hypothetical protein